MRSTSMRRLVGGAAALMLIGTMLLTAAGTTLAAKPVGGTRLIYVGFDPSHQANNNGLMTFTPVSAGQVTISDVYVMNTDNQTLNHVVITFPIAETNATITQVLGANKDNCPTGTDAITLVPSFVCDFGSLKAGDTRAFSLLITAGSVVGPATVTGTIVFDESNNLNGGNHQISNDTGSVNVSKTSCDTVATYKLVGDVSPVDPDSLGDCSGDHQHSGLKFTDQTIAHAASVDDTLTLLAGDCAPGFACIGKGVEAHVNGGADLSPSYLLWTIFYANDVLGTVNPNKVAFVHVIDGQVKVDIILAGNKGLCKTDTQVNCQQAFKSTTIGGVAGITFFVRTPSNGLIKGMN